MNVKQGKDLHDDAEKQQQQQQKPLVKSKKKMRKSRKSTRSSRTTLTTTVEDINELLREQRQQIRLEIQKEFLKGAIDGNNMKKIDEVLSRHSRDMDEKMEWIEKKENTADGGGNEVGNEGGSDGVEVVYKTNSNDDDDDEQQQDDDAEHEAAIDNDLEEGRGKGRGRVRWKDDVEGGDDDNDEIEFKLNEDIYSIMMVTSSTSTPSKSRKCMTTCISKAWYVGILTFLFQCGLGMLLIIEAAMTKGGSGQVPFGIPLHVPVEVTIAQYIAVLISVYAQGRDVLSSIQTFFMLKNPNNVDVDGDFDEYEDDEGDNPWTMQSSSTGWRHGFHILLPNVFKCTQALMLLITSFVCIIMRSTTIMDLMRDFTILFVISQLHRIIFLLMKMGMGLGGEYCPMQSKALWVSETRFYVVRNGGSGKGSILGRIFVLPMSHNVIMGIIHLLLYMNMIGIFTYIVIGQYNGTWMKMLYPNCIVESPRLIGNGICDDDSLHNTEECGFDGGDCFHV